MENIIFVALIISVLLVAAVLGFKFIKKEKAEDLRRQEEKEQKRLLKERKEKRKNQKDEAATRDPEQERIAEERAEAIRQSAKRAAREEQERELQAQEEARKATLEKNIDDLKKRAETETSEPETKEDTQSPEPIEPKVEATVDVPPISEIPKTTEQDRGRGLILLVDDSKVVRIKTSKFLTSRGFTVETAIDGMDALEKLEGGFLPDVILTDAEMPRLDGFVLTEKIKASESLSFLPVVLMTGHASLHVEADRMGMLDGFMPKPFDEEEMDSLLSRLAKKETA